MSNSGLNILNTEVAKDAIRTFLNGIFKDADGAS